MALRKILPEPQSRIKTDSSMFIVNIVLLLILFFLATGRLLNAPTSSVDLSETTDLPIETLPKPLLIVEDDSSLSLNGEPITPELLQQGLAGEDTVYLLIARTASATELATLLAEPALEAVEVRLVTIHKVGGG